MQYNDPNWGRAAANLAAAFAPPTGQEVAGFARAGLLQTQQQAQAAEAQRLADLWAMAGDPQFNQDVFDRRNMAAGNWNPNQSYHAVGVQDATNRRGQDVQSRTSLAMNAANNARALQQTRLQNQASLAGTFFGPLNEGQVQRAVPEGVAGLFQLPAVEERQGLPKPLTEPQVKGRQLQGLIDSGDITTQMIIEDFLGDRTPVQAIGEDGNPVFMTPGAAVAQGARPAGDSATAAEQQIGRVAQYLLDTGQAQTPDEAWNLAVRAVDVTRVSADPLTREVQLVDTTTGGIIAPTAGDDLAEAVMSDPGAEEGEQFGEAFPDPANAFGLRGAVARGANWLSDSLFGTQIAPETADTQRDFGVLREVLRNDVSLAYGRQPPSWVLKEIDNLTPKAGDIFEGPESAQGKLRSLGRLFEEELAGTEEALAGDLSPTERQAAEQQKAGLERSLRRISSALRSFERAQTPSGPTPQPPQPPRPPQPGDEEDGFRFRGGDPGDPNNWERVR